MAEHRSFTRGADALGLTTSAASMQVQALEDYLHVPLFRRNGREIELTSVGALLRPKVEQALADLEHAIDAARADRGSGPLRVTTLAFFLAQWLLGRLSNFAARHPNIDVQIHTSVELADFVKAGIDAGIRFGGGTWPRLHAEKLLDEWLVPVCTPKLLQHHGPIAEARDLKRYKLLHSPYEPWTAWLLEGGGAGDLWPSAGPAFDDAVAIVRAAEAGQGLALARWSETFCQGEIAALTREFGEVAVIRAVCLTASHTYLQTRGLNCWTPRMVIMRQNPVVFFVEGATDPIDDFGAKGVRHVPLAMGPDDCDTRVSCFHLAAGARIAEIPTCQDSVFLVVQGRLTADWCGADIEMSGGMGIVLDTGHAVRVWSDDGAIVILVEAPRLVATRRGISTPDRIMYQGWPGERPPRKTLKRAAQSIIFRARWWRVWLPRALLGAIDKVHSVPRFFKKG